MLNVYIMYLGDFKSKTLNRIFPVKNACQLKSLTTEQNTLCPRPPSKHTLACLQLMDLLGASTTELKHPRSTEYCLALNLQNRGTIINTYANNWMQLEGFWWGFWGFLFSWFFYFTGRINMAVIEIIFLQKQLSQLARLRLHQKSFLGVKRGCHVPPIHVELL